MSTPNLRVIGDRLLSFRKKSGMTQAEVAELAELSDRTYADIERGTANMRTETLLRICQALKVTPNDILCKRESCDKPNLPDLQKMLENCTTQERETAMSLLSVYLKSLK